MWFCVSALSVAEHPEGSASSKQRLWEEHLFLVSADDALAARARAEDLARGEECSYVAVNGSKVSWKFETISKVYEIPDTPTDGTEVFSRFLKQSEVESILSPISSGGSVRE